MSRQVNTVCSHGGLIIYVLHVVRVLEEDPRGLPMAAEYMLVHFRSQPRGSMRLTNEIGLQPYCRRTNAFVWVMAGCCWWLTSELCRRTPPTVTQDPLE